MKARGNTKIILSKVYETQGLIGEASNDFRNDQDCDSMAHGQTKLNKAQELLQEVIDMYEPL
jgi:hypothetical protein